MNDEILTHTCEDCGYMTAESGGQYYEHEPSIWLCDNCYYDRMEV